jgi:hypothetical protein
MVKVSQPAAASSAITSALRIDATSTRVREPLAATICAPYQVVGLAAEQHCRPDSSRAARGSGASNLVHGSDGGYPVDAAVCHAPDVRGHVLRASCHAG